MSAALQMESPAIVAMGPAVDLRLVEPDEFKRAKTVVLQMLSGVGEITTREELEAAVEASASAGFLLGRVEEIRKKVKQPYWDAGKAVDEFASKIVERLVYARALADKQIQTFRRKEVEEQRRAEAAAQAEQRRLENERQAAIAAARKAETEEARNAELAKAKAATEAAKTVLPPPAAPKVDGLSSRMVKVGVVTHAALAYQHRPDFFELVEKKSVIKEAIKGGFSGCPGVVVKEELEVRTR